MENNSDLNDDDIKDFTYTLCDYYVLKFPLEMMNENYEEMLIDEIFDNLIIFDENLETKYKNKIIVALDTTILFRNKNVYKCDTEKCCIQLLNDFNSKSHVLYTGMIFMINNKIIKKSLSQTKIYFNRNSNQSIQLFVNKNFSKIKSAVGCYNIEGPAKKFFENIEGSFYNIIGLDIIKFLRNLKSI